VRRMREMQGYSGDRYSKKPENSVRDQYWWRQALTIYNKWRVQPCQQHQGSIHTKRLHACTNNSNNNNSYHWESGNKKMFSRCLSECKWKKK
jgi:hypothetical protein